MKISNTSERLKVIMRERNLKQIDILNLAKPLCKKYEISLNKNDLSQYVNGKVTPGQKKLAILGLALNVSEAWLMGYDVPMQKYDEHDNLILNRHEENLVIAYRSKPEMQPAVDKLLGVEQEQQRIKKLA